MFDKRETPSVTLIGKLDVQHFPQILLNKRETNLLVWIHQTLVATINKRGALIRIFLHKREHPVMTFPLNQLEHPNLVHISLNNRNHPMKTLTLSKRVILKPYYNYL